MNLSSVFTDVTYKKLVAVDLLNMGSHQHELNGNADLKRFFGTDRSTEGVLRWHYFAEDQDPIEEEGKFKFYDARAKSASRTGRSEWRLYYYGNFLSRASVDDWIFIARVKGGKLFALVFQCGSAWLRAAKALFGVETSTESFDAISHERLADQDLQLLRRQILLELDLDLALPTAKTDEELMLSKFGEKFPTTKVMSEFAREQCGSDLGQADEVLVTWLDREESLFRALENVVIRRRLKEGFTTVDDFIAYSLSVQNRRKSRMGFALQNHLSELFARKKLRFTPQARTESTNRPDFIFPGEKEYHDAEFDPVLLTMLGVKSTSKDRWRQVLTEADRIQEKHLCTLEAGISSKQTDEMQRQRLTLVVPTGLHATYTAAQLTGMLSVTEFVEFVRKKQS